ncbi:arginine--tRNA ligase, chloroplastic/mitochondrial [Tanacetum coccineum]|uniref:arginine--tRNA ligase n=1 Tax=Tanacetum coccineum TaxID=301880 RepID=A0ABQ5ECT8_9ASTR
MKGLGIHSFFSASTLAASTTTVWDEDYTRRLIEIVSLAIHEGNRLRPEEMVNGLGLHSLSSTSKMEASTSTMADVKKEIKRWSFLEEISKPFDDSLKTRFSELEEDVVFSSSTKKEHGDYTCQNVLSIWPKLREERKKRRGPRDVGNREYIKEPRDVGEEIKNNLPKFDVIMIEEGTSIHDFGFITFSLSREWMAKSIHKMIKDGIDTWAPQLPVERVVVDYPSLDEEILVDLFRRRAIGHTLIRMLEYSKVAATIGPTQDILATDEIYHWAREILNKWFSKRKRKGKVVIKGKLPFMLAKRDFDNAYKDLLALWYGHCVHQADWIVNVTPVRQQEYIKMCFTAAKLEKWIPTDRHEPPRTSYAGYRTCTTELSDNLLDEAKTRCKVVEQGDAAKLLGYTAEVVLDCAFTYTYLKNHRLAVWKFDIDEMFHEEVLKESCTFVLPHMVCEYLYDLSKKYNNYYSSACKVGSGMETSTLLLSAATAVVMGKCFHLLGFTTTSSFFDLSLTQLPPGLLFSASQPMDISARDPPRNSRFELFSILPSVITDTVKEGKLFGLIAVSDNYGILSDDGGFYLDEPDYAYVTLFNREWCNSIEMTDCELVYLGNPSCRHSVPFSSSIDIHMRLFVTATNKKKKKDKFFQLCNKVIELDISDFWAEKSDATCGYYAVKDYEDLWKSASVSTCGIRAKGIKQHNNSCSSIIQRIKTCVLKKTRTWMPIEEDVELKRKRTPHRDKLLRRERKADEKRTIRVTTIERETFREDHNIGGSRQRFEMPFKVTGLSNHGQSLGSEISANLQMRAKRKPAQKSILETLHQILRFYNICNKVIELDISDFWAEKSDATCGYYAVKGVDGVTDLHYMLLKNAVDTTVEVTFKTNTDGPKVYGHIFASYGDDFPYDCDRQSQCYYKALLFQPDPLKPLENGVTIPLRRSMLSVPLNGQLVIKAYLEDVESEKVIIEGSCTFKSQRDDSTIGVIKGPEGTNWSLDVKVNWKYDG